MSEQGSGGNVLAAVCSFFYPRIGTIGSRTHISGTLVFYFRLRCIWRQCLNLGAWLDRRYTIAHLVYC